MIKIFISYRRSDSRKDVGRLHDKMTEAFGSRNVFKDVDNIAPGIDFRAALVDAVSNCDVLLVVIGQEWLMAKDEAGNRRLENLGDYVRIEVRTGLQRKQCLVIPILVDHAQMPKLHELPEDIQELVYRNAVVLRDDPDFNPDVARLIRSLKEHFGKLNAENSAIEVQETRAAAPAPSTSTNPTPIYQPPAQITPQPTPIYQPPPQIALQNMPLREHPVANYQPSLNAPHIAPHVAPQPAVQPHAAPTWQAAPGTAIRKRRGWWPGWLPVSLIAVLLVLGGILLLVVASGGNIFSIGAGVSVPEAQPRARPLDHRATADYGSRTLSRGFAPDPLQVTILGERSERLPDFMNGSRCVGYVNDDPDFKVDWAALGGNLHFYVLANVDTVLVIRDPNGNWYCDDDSNGSSNPRINFTAAPSGVYTIWVGSFNATSRINGTLYISEVN